MKTLRILLEEALVKHGSGTAEQRQRVYGAARRGVAKFNDTVRMAELEQHIADIEETYQASARPATETPSEDPEPFGQPPAPEKGQNRPLRSNIVIVGAAVVLAATGAWHLYQGGPGAAGGAQYDTGFDNGLRDFSPSRIVKDGKAPAFPASVVARTDANLSIVELSGENALFTRDTIPVDPSRSYVLKARLRVTKDDPAKRQAEAYLGVVPYDESGSEIKLARGGYRYISSSPIMLGSAEGWTTVEGRFEGTGDAMGEFPPGTASVRPVLIMNFGSAASVTQADFLVFAPR